MAAVGAHAGLTIAASVFLAWLCRFWIPYYAAVFFIVVFCGYPVATRLRSGNYRWVSLCVVIAVLGGGFLGMNWTEVGLDRVFGVP